MNRTIMLLYLASALVAVTHCQIGDDNREIYRIPLGADFSYRCLTLPNADYLSNLSKKAQKLLDWDNYQVVFGKHYKSATEQASRFMQFTGRVAKIAASLYAYLSGCSKYYLSVNKFSDRTNREMRQLYAQKSDEKLIKSSVDGDHPKIKQSMQRRDNTIKEIGFRRNENRGHEANQMTVDWSSSPDRCLQAPRDQGECGCCYAMASVKLYEWLYCSQRNNQQVKFSEQFLVDCGHHTGLKGCTLGSSGNVIKFITLYGLMPDSLYRPYTAREQTCPLDNSGGELLTINTSKSTIKPAKMDYKILREGAIQWEAELAKQPLLVFLRAQEDFLDYGGGLYESTDCDPDYGHFLLLVGHGTENGHPYWLFSNSFGIDWGLKGYIKLSKMQDKCIGYVLKATAEFKESANQAT